MSKKLQFLQLNSSLSMSLGCFFDEICISEDYKYFHPHPMTKDYALHLCEQYAGKDMYFVTQVDCKIIGYGMLRGWDEGYVVPSLAIAISPHYRGIGLGEGFMHFLHVAARLNGAKKIRLKVYPDNTAAHNLYLKLGYIFTTFEQSQLVGLHNL